MRVDQSARVWVVRGAVAVLLGAVGTFSVVATLAQTLASKNVELAHSLLPSDGRIAGRYAVSLVDPKAPASNLPKVEALARKALLRDGTSVSAASLLGLSAELHGDAVAARRAFSYAEKLSRRDLQTQLWAIESAVQRGDIPNALYQYDIALRTSPNVSTVLFPILLAASGTDDAIRSALVRTLAMRPSWSEGFANFAGTKSANPRSTMRLFVDLQRARIKVPDNAQAGLIGLLIAAGATDEAWEYYASVRGGVNRLQSRDPQFAATGTPSVLDWVPVNEGSIVTDLQPLGATGKFNFFVPAGAGGTLLQQLQLLSPGSYRFTGKGTLPHLQRSSQPYWVLKCQNGTELGRAEFSEKAISAGSFAGVFKVPANCPIQILMLTARLSDEASDISGQIIEARLVPQ